MLPTATLHTIKRSARGIALRGTHPRDVIDHAVSLAEYLGQPRRLTLELLREACGSYFVDEGESARQQ